MGIKINFRTRGVSDLWEDTQAIEQKLVKMRRKAETNEWFIFNGLQKYSVNLSACCEQLYSHGLFCFLACRLIVFSAERTTSIIYQLLTENFV